MSNGTRSAPPRTTDRSTIETLGANPAALLAGGVALGVVVGMLLPRIDAERQALDPVGRRLADSATSAVRAAREAGQSEIENLLPDRGAAKERVTQLLDTVLEAARGAAAKA